MNQHKQGTKEKPTIVSGGKHVVVVCDGEKHWRQGGLNEFIIRQDTGPCWWKIAKR